MHYRTVLVLLNSVKICKKYAVVCLLKKYVKNEVFNYIYNKLLGGAKYNRKSTIVDNTLELIVHYCSIVPFIRIRTLLSLFSI